MDTWTIDSRAYKWTITWLSLPLSGEVIIYGGTDPGRTSTFALIGVWQLGSPIGGTRSMVKYGGDLLLLTYDGLIPMAQALQSSRLDPRIALTDKIQGAITEATTTYAATFGWQIFYCRSRM